LSNICGAIDGIHIPLAKRPSIRYILVTLYYYNWQKSYNIVLQVVCNTQKMFCNVYVGQLGGVHDGGQFKKSSLNHELKTQQILQKSMIIIQCVQMTSYLIGNFAYNIHITFKNWKFHNLNDVVKRRYDNNMNFGMVIIKNVFACLKNR
jgi:hypothetical protein